MSLQNLLNQNVKDSHTLAVAAYFFHWMVSGENFKQDHDFFGSISDAAYSDLDRQAEAILAISGTVDSGSVTQISFKSEAKTAADMYGVLLQLVDASYVNLLKTYNEAEKEIELHVSNIIQDIIEANRKLAWMLRATIGKRGS